MTNDDALDLASICADLAAELDEVSGSAVGDAVVYARGSAVFARVSGSLLEVRLPADIAEAALRTTDTSVGTEPGWIRLRPRGGEQHETDRASAWFQTAWRHASRE